MRWLNELRATACPYPPDSPCEVPPSSSRDCVCEVGGRPSGRLCMQRIPAGKSPAFRWGFYRHNRMPCLVPAQEWWEWWEMLEPANVRQTRAMRETRRKIFAPFPFCQQ